MKTGTLTFHAPNNNGSFLQAYALQQVLIKQLGVENEIIDFRSEKQINQYKTFRTVRNKYDFLKNMVAVPRAKRLNQRYTRFENVRDTYLQKTPCINSEEETLERANQYDIVIIGSDQIWNTDAPDFSKVYFCPGVTTRKIAYAVSCGSAADDAELSEYEEAINALEQISVRETAVARQIRTVYEGEVAVVLDPTLLLTKEDYQLLYSREPLVQGEYIFYYSINYSKDSLKAVSALSQMTGLPVYTVFTSFHTVLCERYNIRVMYTGGPNEFLNLLDHAKYVATNSFHGTAFSLIFRKNFYHLCDIVDDQMKKDDRIDGLLEQLGLENRNYSYVETQLLPEVSYEAAEIKLDELRQDSIEWLRTAIGAQIN